MDIYMSLPLQLGLDTAEDEPSKVSRSEGVQMAVSRHGNAIGARELGDAEADAGRTRLDGNASCCAVLQT